MALQSEAASPMVGEAYKDTYGGDTKSEEETEDEEDLEEGEILDSGNEGDEEDTKHAPTSNSSPITAKAIQEIFKLAENAAKSEEMDKLEKQENTNDWMNDNNHVKFKRKYVDHDISSDALDDGSEDKESGWYQRLSRKKQSLQDGPLDYRKELELYAGSPGSSPERDGKSSKKRSRSAAAILKAKAKKAAAKRAKLRLERKSGKKVISRRPCKFYLEGNCTKGGDCPFQHMKPRERKRELCRYYLNGHCSKGKQCPFMHDDFPCKFFHTGAKCYSGDGCRFSHKPLTEETEQLLKECLKGYHDDYHEPRKRQRSKSPEPPPQPVKRPCLLGSPPRHIREAEETKRWQEEMIYLQREKSADFHIRLSPTKQFSSPTKFVKPNFYVDTMQTPPKQGPAQNAPYQVPLAPPPLHFPPLDAGNHCPPKLEDEDLRQPLNWTNICALVESMKGPKKASLDIPDFEEESQFEETAEDSDFREGRLNIITADGDATDYGENSNSEDTSNNRSPTPPTHEIARNSSPVENQSSSRSSSPPPSKESPAEPIVVPSYLPRKQQELFLRIQRHQKMKSAEADGKADASEKSDSEAPVQKALENNMRKDEEENYEDKAWSSSDDDDVDKPLTDVLKKLRQTPPPKPKEVPAQKTTLDISQMLSSIMQKANENSKTPAMSQEQGKFWQNILSGTVLPQKPTASAPVSSIAPQETKRRVLLPDPKPVEKLPVGSRDPRLKNRDPRTAVPKAAAFTSNSLPVTAAPLLPLEPRASNADSLPGHHRDINSLVPSHISAVVVDGLKANIPYKLHNVTCKPLNYSCYIQASHSDPKLLNDPRLRKHFSQETTNHIIKLEPDTDSKHATLPDLPLFSSYSLPPQENHIPLGVPVSSLPLDVPRLPELKLPQQMSQVNDPRTRRVEHRRPSASNSPPQTVDTHPTPLPHVSTPTIASHLPRAIADPRMAKLHKPHDPRKPRVAVEASSKANASRLQTLSSTTAASTTTTISRLQESVPKTEEPQKVSENSSEKDETTAKKKLGESKKNKAVHRNRKNSMDYASPLNSCDDSSSSTLNYNSYNQRPKTRPRNSSVEVPVPKETLPTPSSLVNALKPDFSASDSSNLDCDSMDANASLKDMFKTIDPTASPFG